MRISTAPLETALPPQIGKGKAMNQLPRSILAISTFTTLLALMVCFNVSCSTPHPALSVFAAAGAKPALDEVGRRFEEKYGTVVEINYGGGGEVLNQIILTRSGDVYVAPEQSFMETAVEKQAVYPETIESIAYMIPVIAVLKGNPRNIATLADLARPGVRVAVTRPETTLLGKYTPEIFNKAGLADAIGKNIVTETARPDSLLTALVVGGADAGILWHFYRLQAPEKIEIIYLAPEQLTGIGEMQIAVSAYSRNQEVARQFIDFVTSSDGREVFKESGYFTDVEEVSRYWH
jgi:molybdate transport system substrate-binding protein